LCYECWMLKVNYVMICIFHLCDLVLCLVDFLLFFFISGLILVLVVWWHDNFSLINMSRFSTGIISDCSLMCFFQYVCLFIVQVHCFLLAGCYSSHLSIGFLLLHVLLIVFSSSFYLMFVSCDFLLNCFDYSLFGL